MSVRTRLTVAALPLLFVSGTAAALAGPSLSGVVDGSATTATPAAVNAGGHATANADTSFVQTLVTQANGELNSAVQSFRAAVTFAASSASANADSKLDDLEAASSTDLLNASADMQAAVSASPQMAGPAFVAFGGPSTQLAGEFTASFDSKLDGSSWIANARQAMSDERATANSLAAYSVTATLNGLDQVQAEINTEMASLSALPTPSASADSNASATVAPQGVATAPSGFSSSSGDVTAPAPSCPSATPSSGHGSVTAHGNATHAVTSGSGAVQPGVPSGVVGSVSGSLQVGNAQ